MEERKIDYTKEGIKLHYLNLMLEVTRRCELRCEHCMRGEPQDLDMSDEILEKVFSQVDGIYHLSLTGGEPFLVPEVIEKMVDIIIEKGIKVWRCTSVDNGFILDERAEKCIKAFNRLGEYIVNSVWKDAEVREEEKDRLPISIAISNSEFHANNIELAIETYKKYATEYTEIMDQGDWETGLVDKNGNKIKNRDTKKSRRWLIKEGRAKTNDLKGASYTSCTYCVDFYKEKGKRAVATSIQVCANGNVTMAEPISFETMDNKSMGNILEEELSCLIHKWNWNEPLSKDEVDEYCKNLDFINNPKIPEDKKVKRKIRNIYLNLKKTLFVEGHKDYPYLDKKDLSIAVICKIALLMLDFTKEHENLSGIAESEIIKIIVKNETVGDFSEDWSKQDLENLLNGLIEKNKKAMIKDKGFLYFLTHSAFLSLKAYADLYEFGDVYEK